MSRKNVCALLLLTVSALASACFEGKSEASPKDKDTEPNKVATGPASTPAASAAADNALQVVNDPRIDSPPPKVSTASTAFIKRTLLPGLKEIWTTETCDEDFKIMAAANGSFSESDSKQTAYLYQYCQKGSTVVKDGVAIFQDSKLVENIVFTAPDVAEDENIVYDGGYATTLSALKDVNKNGLDELALFYGSYQGGAFLTAVDILELPNKTVKFIGSLETYSYNNYAGEGYRITVKPGAPPVFYAETYKQDNEKWTKKESSKPVKLDHNQVNKYQFVG
jgi:hypothetical protein